MKAAFLRNRLDSEFSGLGLAILSASYKRNGRLRLAMRLCLRDRLRLSVRDRLRLVKRIVDALHILVSHYC